MNGLSSDTNHYYRLQLKAIGSDDWAAGAEHALRTHRAPGDTFSTIPSTHLDH